MSRKVAKNVDILKTRGVKVHLEQHVQQKKKEANHLRTDVETTQKSSPQKNEILLCQKK